MFDYFKNKIRLKIDYYAKGYKKGYSDAEYKNKIQNQINSKNYRKEIEKRDEKIKKLTKDIERIDNSLENFSAFFARAGHIATLVEEKAEQEMRVHTGEYQTIRNVCTEMLSLKRNFQNKYPKVNDKIKKAQRKNIE